MATFTNQATLTYSGGTTSSNITTGELLEVLTASKTAVVPTYRSGRPITYLITLVNSGAAALNGLTVTDDLGGYALTAALSIRWRTPPAPCGTTRTAYCRPRPLPRQARR